MKSIKSLLDVSTWLALAIPEHPFHTAAAEFVKGEAKPDSILFCRVTQQSFLRLLTTSTILKEYGLPPLSNEQAWEMYEAFVSDPRIGFAIEPASLESTWRGFSSLKTASPKVWTDAYLAAFAASAKLRLVTFDTDFRKYEGLALRLIGSN